MAKPHYDWKRFWVPFGESVHLDGDYLMDPDGELGRIANSKAVPISALLEHRCLALLGEPGMGKTTAMEDARREIEQHASAAGEEILWPDLHICGSDSSLGNHLFDTQQFESWLRGKKPLNLFLDSFDECCLRVEVFVPLLISRLRPGNCSNLRLRIACRTAEWPRLLHDGLAEIYPDAVHIYELAPLRKNDVARAAESEGLGVEQFLAEVDRCEAAPFAGKPVTLKMLLGRFKGPNSLPSDLASLYRAGCKELCKEPSKTRTGRSTAPKLSVDQRFQFARRIAAMMAFCRRATILQEEGDGRAESTDLTIAEIVGAGEREKTSDGEVEMTIENMREVLNTGLFSGRSPGRLGWAHQTYLEFLASDYVLAHGFSSEQIASVVMHPLDSSRVIPQLHGVAAWLAGKSQDVFSRICATDPRVLLAADKGNLDDDRRARLVDSFLDHVEARNAHVDWDAPRYFSRLKHVGLVGQLERRIKDVSLRAHTRCAAIDIGVRCKCEGLEVCLLEIALNPDEEASVRSEAASAISGMADNVVKLQLRPLLHEENDEVKGQALFALRGLLKTEEIFNLLTVPANAHHWGAYKYFVDQLVRDLSPEDLPCALEWAAKFPSRYHDHYFDLPREEILKRAREHLDSPEVVTAFAKLARVRMKLSEAIVDGDKAWPESFNRKLLIQAIIDTECETTEAMSSSAPVTSALDWWHEAIGQSALVRAEDLAWVVERYLAVAIGPVRQAWADLLKVLANDICAGRSSVDPVIEAATIAPELNDLLPNLLGWIDIDSDRAQRLRSREQAFQKRPQEDVPRPGPSLAERMTEQLSRCEYDIANAFPALLHHMAFGDMATDRVHPFVAPIEQFPGWRDADSTRRRAILTFGKKYLVDLQVEPSERTGVGITIAWPVRVAYLTLAHLEKLEPTWLDEAPPNVWRRWAGIVVDQTAWQAQPTRLLDLAFERAPEGTLARFAGLIDWEDRTHRCVASARRLAKFWNPRVEGFLLAQARVDGRAPAAVGELLDLLLSKHSRQGIELACSLIPSGVPDDSHGRETAREAAVSLLVHEPAIGWPRVRQIVIEQSDFGRDVAIGAAKILHPRLGTGRSTWDDSLIEIDVADLYAWLCREFPHSGDPDRTRPGFIGDREQVADLRDHLLGNLAGRGTLAVVRELTRIVGQPGTTDLRPWIAHAKRAMVETNWSGPTTKELLKMAEDTKKRLVSSGEHLHAAVLDSLARYQRDLRSEIPAYEELWDETRATQELATTNESKGPRHWTPKREESLSNYIARHLRRDLLEFGVIINREVQIRFNPDGQRTDIHVDAIRCGADGLGEDRLSVIIEVKGCWNDSLKTAMEDQLKNRYLNGNECRHGIYLVVWFNCEHWDPNDNRRRKAESWGRSIGEARTYFEDQARSLSDDRCTLATVVVDARLGTRCR